MLFDAIAGYVQGKADIRPARYVAPYGRAGLAKMIYPGGEVEFIARGPDRTWRPGTLLPTGSELGGPHRVILQDAPPGHMGASGFVAERYPPDEIDGPLVFELDPRVYVSGLADQSGKAIGVGFADIHGLAVTRINPTSGEDELDPRFVLHSLTRVSSTEITFRLDVDASVPHQYHFDCAVVAL